MSVLGGVGAGPSTADTFFGWAVAVRMSEGEAEVRPATTLVATGGNEAFTFDDPAESWTAAALLFGARWRRGAIDLNASAGPAAYLVVRRGDILESEFLGGRYEEVRSFGPGFAVYWGATTFYRSVGLGLNVVGVAATPGAGATVTLALVVGR